MTNSEVLRRLEHRMDEDTHFANNMKRAIETENDYWLSELIGDVIGFVVEFASDIWNWINDLFN